MPINSNDSTTQIYFQHRSALNELISIVKNSFLLQKKSSDNSPRNSPTEIKPEGLREVLENREKLLVDVGRTVRLGRLLRTRLREPLYSQVRYIR